MLRPCGRPTTTCNWLSIHRRSVMLACQISATLIHAHWHAGDLATELKQGMGTELVGCLVLQYRLSEYGGTVGTLPNATVVILWYLKTVVQACFGSWAGCAGIADKHATWRPFSLRRYCTCDSFSRGPYSTDCFDSSSPQKRTIEMSPLRVPSCLAHHLP